MKSIFQIYLYCENTISKMTRFPYNNQNENWLNYFDFFRQVVELQNETNHRRTILFVDLNIMSSRNKICLSIYTWKVKAVSHCSRADLTVLKQIWNKNIFQNSTTVEKVSIQLTHWHKSTKNANISTRKLLHEREI